MNTVAVSIMIPKCKMLSSFPLTIIPFHMSRPHCSASALRFLSSAPTPPASRSKIPMLRPFIQTGPPPTFHVPLARTVKMPLFASAVIPAVELLTAFIEESRGKLIFLTGAGVSTDSGLPDYRGEKGVYTVNPNYAPILFQDFVTKHPFRQRYWARAYLGWSYIEKAPPNSTHKALAQLQASNHISHIITQNVDGLHQAAGATAVTELHGTLHKVNCLKCEHYIPRTDFQKQLGDINPSWRELHQQLQNSQQKLSRNSDGDVELPTGVSFAEFVYPSCELCGGILKPSIVFFGENIAMTIKEQTTRIIENCNALLVVGSSLATYSAFRIVRAVSEAGKKVGILNLGPTRGDNLANFRIHASCGDVTPLVLRFLEEPEGIKRLLENMEEADSEIPVSLPIR